MIHEKEYYIANYIKCNDQTKNIFKLYIDSLADISIEINSHDSCIKDDFIYFCEHVKKYDIYFNQEDDETLQILICDEDNFAKFKLSKNSVKYISNKTSHIDRLRSHFEK